MGDDDIQGPKTTTTVSKDAAEPTPETTKTTTVEKKKGKAAAERTTTTETQRGADAKPAEKTTTTEEGQRTFLERVLGDAGLVFLQIGVIAFAAFLAAAMTQRVLVGEYGGFKLGSLLELNAVARASTTGLDELKDALKKLRKDAALNKNLTAVQKESRQEDAAINRELALLLKRLDYLEQRVDDRG